MARWLFHRRYCRRRWLALRHYISIGNVNSPWQKIAKPRILLTEMQVFGREQMPKISFGQQRSIALFKYLLCRNGLSADGHAVTVDWKRDILGRLLARPDVRWRSHLSRHVFNRAKRTADRQEALWQSGSGVGHGISPDSGLSTQGCGVVGWFGNQPIGVAMFSEFNLLSFAAGAVIGPITIFLALRSAHIRAWQRV